MTRRVAAALLVLTLAILVAAVVPLALGAIAHERDSFVQDTARTAASIAGIAETPLGDHLAEDPAMVAALKTAARQGDELLLLSMRGRVVVRQGHPHDPVWQQLVAQSRRQNDPTTELTGDRAIAVQTVWENGKLTGKPIGTVVLERPIGPLNQNIANLWFYLIGLSGAAMAAAVFIAIYFARWVSRPLARLDGAARKIADGDLTVRAKTRYGPPELRRMAATFNMMAGRLEALVHGHRVMLADASHQLRTPLTALRLRLDLLAADSPPAAAAELAGAQEEIARLSRLVDGLLATARAEAVTEQLEHIDVAEAVSERVAAWQPVADGHGVKLAAEMPSFSSAPLAALGAGHLEQVLDNLIDNAIEAIGDREGTVRVLVARSDTSITLTVADDGPGMTPHERSRAFLRYTTGSQNGTGLGLAIVHRLVTANGGTIRLTDTPGGGLTVVVELPVEPLLKDWPPYASVPRLLPMAQLRWKPVWTVPAAMRAVRATVVIPSLFALTYKVVADPQMALFATFGGFATLVIAGFGGTRRDKLAAHAGLAVAGSLALIIGTLASGATWLAAVVTVPVAFAAFFAGIGGPNAASGATAAMFAYVLPVASAGGAATIPSRLEGWWLASAAAAIAVLLLSPPNPGSRLREAAAELAGEIADRVRKAAAGEATKPEAMAVARDRLRAAFTAAPFRPTGLAAPDQALSSLVQVLDWGATQAGDAFDGHVDLASGCPADRVLLRQAAGLFDDTRALLSGQAAAPDFAAADAAREASAQHLRELSGRAGEPDARLAAAQAVHAQGLAVVARSAAADALIASRRTRFSPAVEALAPAGGATGLASAVALVRQHATIRSVWFLNSLRAALALAAAVAVADLSGVQHGFWVVLGTLSVLRTSAASTGATAWRALAGTVVGFAVGAGLLAAIGTSSGAMWAVLPVAVLVAAYAPGTTPFLVGQAAFTVTIVVLFNLLQPVGWTLGLLRTEDVAIGCAVSLAVGVAFWPRGVSAVVADDLADAFRSGAAYLTQAVEWALSELLMPPGAALTASSAAVRLDDALRGFLTEQGSKRLGKEDLWALVNASSRLRLTAYTLASLRTAQPADGKGFGGACLPLAGSEEYAGAPACVALRSAVAGLAGFYGAVAGQVSRPGPGQLTGVPLPALVGPALPRHEGDVTEAAVAPAHQLPHPHLLWVQEHLHHLSASARTVSEPALHMAEIRQRPWWR